MIIHKHKRVAHNRVWSPGLFAEQQHFCEESDERDYDLNLWFPPGDVAALHGARRLLLV